MLIEPRQGDALLVIDVQNDFLPGGALAVPKGDLMLAPLNVAIELFSGRGLPILFTRDWHSPDHSSFQRQGGPWPEHCVAGSWGAEFSARLVQPPGMLVVSKGSLQSDESYSNFESTELEAELRRRAIKRLFVGGLATEYCVRSTVKDALQRGFDVVLLGDCVRAINLQPRDGKRAIEEMQRQGAILASAEDLR